MNSASRPDTAEYVPTEAEIDQVVVQAVAAAAKGENIEALLEAMLASFPPDLRDKIRKKFSAALTKRGFHQPAKDAEVVPHSALGRIRDVFTLTAKQTLARIASLTRSRPDVAARIEEAGKMLIRNGVVLESVQLSEADLGTLAPSAGIKQTQERGGGRGA